jgi:hypothetical protein
MEDTKRKLLEDLRGMIVEHRFYRVPELLNDPGPVKGDTLRLIVEIALMPSVTSNSQPNKERIVAMLNYALKCHAGRLGLIGRINLDMRGLRFVFTGFRNGTLQGDIERMGGAVDDRIRAMTTHVVAKDTSRHTTKFNEAISRGIEVISLNDLNIWIDSYVWPQ